MTDDSQPTERRYGPIPLLPFIMKPDAATMAAFDRGAIEGYGSSGVGPGTTHVYYDGAMHTVVDLALGIEETGDLPSDAWEKLLSRDRLSNQQWSKDA